MYKITDEQIDFILGDLQANGVVIEDLQYNLLDHICCIIENEMPENEDFHRFYAYIIPRFFKKELKEIQDETEQLLTFKNYYAMKNTLKITGIASALFTLAGAILKTMHWPGASIAIVLATVLFSFVFLPLMIVMKFRDEESITDKLVFSFGLILGMAASAGVAFKLMHYPGANILMRGSLTGIVFGYVPLYFITRIRRPDNKFNTTVNSVLMMAAGGLLYALFNLGYSHNVNDSITASERFLQHNTAQMISANDRLLSNISDKSRLSGFQEMTRELYDRIDGIKANLIAQSENISHEEAKKFDISGLKHPNDYNIVKTQFENAEGIYSLKSLEEAIAGYNTKVKDLFPGQPEKEIAIGTLQLDRTILSILLHELTQVQLQIVSSENSYLSSAILPE